MPQALKCPTCSAPLDFPTDGRTAIHCPYCNTSVMLNGEPAPAVPADDVSAAFAPLIGQAFDLAEVMRHLSAGNKIGAIKAYRVQTGTSLVIAKNAVEAMAAGRPVTHITGKQVAAATTVASSGALLGCGLVVGMVALVLVIVIGVTRSVKHQITTATATVKTAKPNWVPQTYPPIKITPAAVPAFATMALEFGSEGIGAGQFKDARSIALDGQGHIYVGEYSDGRVQVFDTDGKFQSTWSIGRDKSLLNLAADRKGTVYAVVPGHILRFEGATGRAMGEVENVADDGEEEYMDAFVALNGEIWAVGNNSDLVVLDAAGKINRILKSRQKIGEDVAFTRVIVLPTGEIFAMDHQKGVFKFGADGRYINRFGGTSSNGRSPGHLLAPKNLACDGKGRIYVSDSSLTIQVFDSDGTYIDNFGGRDIAFGLAIDDQNAIYACVRNRHVIRKFVPEK